MDIKKWMDIWGKIAYANAVEYVAERLYKYGATSADIRSNNAENRHFYERVADYMDFMQDMQDMQDMEDE